MIPQPTALVAHPSPDLYGSDRVLLETLSALVEAGYRTVLTLPDSGPLVDAARARGAEVEICPTPIVRKSALRPVGMARLVLLALRSLRPSRRLLRALNPDLLVVNTVTIPLWIVLGRLGRVRTVCHVHEAEASQPALLRKGLYAPLLLAQRLVVNSRFSLEVLASSWPRLGARSSVVYNGVPGPETPPQPPRPDLQGAMRLLFVGRLSPRKGPQVAITALAELVQRGVDARLDLLGAVFPGYEWFERELREQAARVGLDSRVEFIGFDPDIWAHLAAADVICVPSTVDEPFGNTAVEAVLAQRPLVVSDTSGLKEAASGFESVRFVPAGDPSAVAAAVQDLQARWDELPGPLARDRSRALERYAPEVYRRAVVAAAVD